MGYAEVHFNVIGLLSTGPQYFRPSDIKANIAREKQATRRNDDPTDISYISQICDILQLCKLDRFASSNPLTEL